MRVLRCTDCGFEARGVDQEELADRVRAHARDAHGMELTQDEALLLAFHAQLGALPTIRRQAARQPHQEER